MRNSTLLGAVTASAAAVTLALAPTAFAAPPGDNGTVKIHDSTTGEELRRNEPHVCEFYVVGFGFDAAQAVSWTITEMPPTGTQGTVAATGALTLDVAGEGRTDDLVLASGHYKLTWQFEGEHGAGKHKVFWVDCEDEEAPAEADEPAGTTPNGATTEEVAEEPDLAETGSSAPTVGIAAGATALLAAGAYLALRRRRATPTGQ